MTLDRLRPVLQAALLPGTAIVLAIGIFLVDALTPLDAAIAVLHVVVILLVALSGSARATRFAAVTCTVLTLLGFAVSQHMNPSDGQLARCIFSLLAIATTSLLALRNVADMTQRRRAEQALALNEAFLAEAQRLSRTGSIVVRWPDGVMAWSDEARRILGYSRAIEPSFRRVLDRIHPGDADTIERAHRAMQGAIPFIEVKHRLVMPDGAIRYVHLVARLSMGAADYQEYVGALMDITESTQTQQALQRTLAELAHVSRVTTLGQLAATITHEVTQPIAAIVTCGESALRWLNRPTPDVGEATDSVAQILRDARRASDIIRKVRGIAQRSDPHYELLSLDDLVTESMELIRRDLDENQVAATLDLDTATGVVCGDRTQLQQVLLNLTMNALQAMAAHPAPGRLRITTRIVPAGDSGNDAAPTTQQVETVLVSVRDSGPGFASDDRDAMFQAFYTTKSDGMGMGLSICRSIVEAHGGSILAHTASEGGAQVDVRLPLHVGSDVCGPI